MFFYLLKRWRQVDIKYENNIIFKGSVIVCKEQNVRWAFAWERPLVRSQEIAYMW